MAMDIVIDTKDLLNFCPFCGDLLIVYLDKNKNFCPRCQQYITKVEWRNFPLAEKEP